MADAPQKTILLIAKLKRLAAGSTGAESENAMREANRLEAKYGIEVDVEDLDEFVSSEEAQARFEERVVHVCSYAERPWHDWRQFLLQTLAPLYECASFPKDVESAELFFLYAGGDPEQLEYCVTHFEWLCYRVEVVADDCDWDSLTRKEKRGVRWGAMDRLIRNMTKWGQPQAQEAGTEVTIEAAAELEGYVNPEALVPKRGLVKVGGPGDARANAPDPLDAKPPPMWAYRRGYNAAAPEEPQPPLVLLQPVENLPGLDGSTTSILSSMGYLTVAQLVRARPKELIAHKGIGPKRLDRIRAALEKQGLRLMADWGSRDEPERQPEPDSEKKRARRSARDRLERLRGRGRRR